MLLRKQHKFLFNTNEQQIKYDKDPSYLIYIWASNVKSVDFRILSMSVVCDEGEEDK